MSPITLRDGLGATFTVAAEISGGVATPHSVPEVAGLAVSTANPLPVGGSLVAVPTAGMLTDRSIVTTSATSTQLFPANTSRKYYSIQAPNTVGLWINRLGGSAGPSLAGCNYIPASGWYESGGFVPVAAITVYCATAGQMISAQEG